MQADDSANEARNRLKFVQESYVNVFGKDGERTVFQQAVLDDLSRFVRYGDTVIVKDSSGRYDGGLTAYKVGMQDVVKRINLQITWRHNEHSSSNSESDD